MTQFEAEIEPRALSWVFFPFDRMDAERSYGQVRGDKLLTKVTWIYPCEIRNPCAKNLLIFVSLFE
jgi:hypothetical protein